MYEDCFSEDMKQDIKERLNRIVNDERYKEDSGFLGWIRDFVLGIWEIESDKFDFIRFLIDLTSNDNKVRRTAMVDLIDRVKNAENAFMRFSQLRSYGHLTVGQYEKEVKPFLKVISVSDLEEWLSSFDTSSATECFTAIGILKERLGHE